MSGKREELWRARGVKSPWREERRERNRCREERGLAWEWRDSRTGEWDAGGSRWGGGTAGTAGGGLRGRTGGKTMSAWWGTSWNDVRNVVSGRVRCVIIETYTSPVSAR